jgi:hypothetical protein
MFNISMNQSANKSVLDKYILSIRKKKIALQYLHL